LISFNQLLLHPSITNCDSQNIYYSYSAWWWQVGFRSD